MTTQRGTRGRSPTGQDARRRILQAAFEIASERGYDGTTLSLVTARAGLRPGSVYWQFDSKDKILAEVIEVSYQQWQADMDAASAEWTATSPDAAAADSEDPRERARATARRLGHTLAAGLLGRPQFWTLGLMLALQHHLVDTSARQRFGQIRAATQDLLEKRFATALPGHACDADPGLPRTLAHLTMIWSDGLLIGAQAGEAVDVPAALRLLSSGLEAVMLEAISGGGPAGTGTQPAI